MSSEPRWHLGLGFQFRQQCGGLESEGSHLAGQEHHPPESWAGRGLAWLLAADGLLAGPAGSVGQGLGWPHGPAAGHWATPPKLHMDETITDQQVARTWAGRVGGAVSPGPPWSCCLQPRPPACLLDAHSCPEPEQLQPRLASHFLLCPNDRAPYCHVSRSPYSGGGVILFSSLLPREQRWAEGLGCDLSSPVAGKLVQGRRLCWFCPPCPSSQSSPRQGRGDSCWHWALQFPEAGGSGQQKEHVEWPLALCGRVCRVVGS